MKVLLVSGGARLASQPVVEYAEELAPQGVEVSLATWAAPTRALVEAATEVVVWGPRAVAPEPVPAAVAAPRPAASAPPPTGVARVKAAYAWRALRLRKKLRPYKRQVTRVAQRLGRTGQADRTWLRLRHDARVLHLAREADVIVAVDQVALLAVWKLAKRLPGPEVVYGVAASRNVLTRLASSS